MPNTALDISASLVDNLPNSDESREIVSDDSNLLNKLPIEIKERILNELSFSDLFRLRMLSKAHYEIVTYYLFSQKRFKNLYKTKTKLMSYWINDFRHFKNLILNNKVYDKEDWVKIFKHEPYEYDLNPYTESLYYHNLCAWMVLCILDIHDHTFIDKIKLIPSNHFNSLLSNFDEISTKRAVRNFFVDNFPKYYFLINDNFRYELILEKRISGLYEIFIDNFFEHNHYSDGFLLTVLPKKFIESLINDVIDDLWIDNPIVDKLIVFLNKVLKLKKIKLTHFQQSEIFTKIIVMQRAREDVLPELQEIIFWLLDGFNFLPEEEKMLQVCQFYKLLNPSKLFDSREDYVKAQEYYSRAPILFLYPFLRKNYKINDFSLTRILKKIDIRLPKNNLQINTIIKLMNYLDLNDLGYFIVYIMSHLENVYCRYNESIFTKLSEIFSAHLGSGVKSYLLNFYIDVKIRGDLSRVPHKERMPDGLFPVSYDPIILWCFNPQVATVEIQSDYANKIYLRYISFLLSSDHRCVISDGCYEYKRSIENYFIRLNQLLEVFSKKDLPNHIINLLFDNNKLKDVAIAVLQAFDSKSLNIAYLSPSLKYFIHGALAKCEDNADIFIKMLLSLGQYHINNKEDKAYIHIIQNILIDYLKHLNIVEKDTITLRLLDYLLGPTKNTEIFFGKTESYLLLDFFANHSQLLTIKGTDTILRMLFEKLKQAFKPGAFLSEKLTQPFEPDVFLIFKRIYESKHEMLSEVEKTKYCSLLISFLNQDIAKFVYPISRRSRKSFLSAADPDNYFKYSNLLKSLSADFQLMPSACQYSYMNRLMYKISERVSLIQYFPFNQLRDQRDVAIYFAELIINKLLSIDPRTNIMVLQSCSYLQLKPFIILLSQIAIQASSNFFDLYGVFMRQFLSNFKGEFIDEFMVDFKQPVESWCRQKCYDETNVLRCLIASVSFNVELSVPSQLDRIQEVLLLSYEDIHPLALIRLVYHFPVLLENHLQRLLGYVAELRFIVNNSDDKAEFIPKFFIILSLNFKNLHHQDQKKCIVCLFELLKNPSSPNVRVLTFNMLCDLVYYLDDDQVDTLISIIQIGVKSKSYATNYIRTIDLFNNISKLYKRTNNEVIHDFLLDQVINNEIFNGRERTIADLRQWKYFDEAWCHAAISCVDFFKPKHIDIAVRLFNRMTMLHEFHYSVLLSAINRKPANLEKIAETIVDNKRSCEHIGEQVKMATIFHANFMLFKLSEKDKPQTVESKSTSLEM